MNCTSKFVKAVFHKCYLVHSWILCPACSLSFTWYFQLSLKQEYCKSMIKICKSMIKIALTFSEPNISIITMSENFIWHVLKEMININWITRYYQGYIITLWWDIIRNSDQILSYCLIISIKTVTIVFFEGNQYFHV